MRQFSIHKVNKPMMRGQSGAEDEGEVSSGKPGAGDYYDAGENAGGPFGNGRHHEMHDGSEPTSMLTAEEQEALQPKEIKVVNPWIHQATHKEYLENVKVSDTSYLGHLSAPAVLFKYYFLSRDPK